MIKLSEISKTFHTGKTAVKVIKNLSLSIETGEFVALTGSSGSGKSTLLNILGLLDSFDAGAYSLNGVEASQLSEKSRAKIRNEMIGFVFQAFHLIPYKNALDNVCLPLIYKGSSRRQRELIAAQLLERVGLGERMHHMPNELSGGQKQRVAIARALACSPQVILADEPTGALDSKATEDVMEIFKDLNRQGTTIVMVTHEMDIAQMASRNIKLRDGRIE